MDLQLVITLKGGELSVSGPIDNKIIAYGMLEIAREQIAAYHVANAALVKPAVALPGGGPHFGRKVG